MSELKPTAEESIRHFEAQQKRYVREHNGKPCPHYANAIDALRCAQPADVARVMHGRWEQRKTPLGKTYSICSNCSTDFKFITDKGTLARLDMDGMPYCPNCGARMDKEDET